MICKSDDECSWMILIVSKNMTIIVYLYFFHIHYMHVSFNNKYIVSTVNY